MWREARSTVGRVVVSLLMLATLLVYAAPSHARLLSHHPSSSPHEHVLDAAHDNAVAAVADHEHEHGQGPCKDQGLRDDGACCSVAQCLTMHSGLPAASFEPFVPRVTASNHLPTLATPDGIGSDPALRPPL